jgi:ankyrin repeat protein
MNSIRREDLEMADLLMDNGADVNIQDNIGKTALMYARELGLQDISIKLLTKGANRDLKE